MFRRYVFGAVLVVASLGAFEATSSAAQLGDVEHIIVIYLENHSFDNLFGFFPNADGIAAAGATKIQVKEDGQPYDFLPRVKRWNGHDMEDDGRFPNNLPNQPFSIEAYVPLGQNTGDLIHRFYDQQAQINGGLMNKFAAYSDAGALTMGFYDGSRTKLWRYAQHYTLADHFFHAAFGGSFLNHFWMICACTPRYPDAPDDIIAKLDADGHVLNRWHDIVTPDGYAVNTIQPSLEPHSPKKKPEYLLPPQDMPTIGDRLSDREVTWAWYSGGWDAAIAGHAPKSFQFHHQPFAYFKNYAEDTWARKQHLKDAEDLMKAIHEGTGLPQVVFYKPVGKLNEHPGYANVLEGDKHVGELLCTIEKSPYWSKSIVIVTFDENGGYWDHVPPPKIDRWGPGLRVPTVIVSPFAKRGFIDHTNYDSTAILKLIETRFGLEPLSERDKEASDLSNALDFGSLPTEPVCIQ